MPQTKSEQPTAARVNRSASNAQCPSGEGEPTPSLIRVFETIRALYDAGVEPTRDLITEKTGLPKTTVDDRIKVLRAEHMITAQAQCYRPIFIHAPARPVSVTALENGIYKVEVGDDMLSLTPTEARKVGLGLQGPALESAALGRVDGLMNMVLQRDQEIKTLKARVKNLEVQEKKNTQVDLFE